MKKETLVKTIAEVAVFASLGYVLDLVAGLYSHGLFVNGGSIGIAMVCVFFIAFRRGLLPGIFTGLIIGLLQLTGGVYLSEFADTPWKVFCQVALDYWLAYPVAGFAGIFYWAFKKNPTKKGKIADLIFGSLVGGFAKYLCHFLSGILFWPTDQWGVGGPAIYSVLYNGSYMLPSIILSGALLILLFVRVPMLFEEPNNYQWGHPTGENSETK